MDSNDSSTHFSTYFLCSGYPCCALAETVQGLILVFLPCHTVTVLECMFTEIQSWLAGVEAAVLGSSWQAPALAAAVVMVISLICVSQATWV